MYDYPFLVVSSISFIFLISFILWMIGLLIVMMQELFSVYPFKFRDYFVRVGKSLFYSLEIATYTTFFVSLVRMLFADRYVEHMIMSACSLLMGVILLGIRQKIFGLSGKGKRKERHSRI